MPFFEDLYLCNSKTHIFKNSSIQRILLTVWKCKHPVKRRTYFEYRRNIVILEANQVPNLHHKWKFYSEIHVSKSGTNHTNSNWTLLSLIFRRFFTVVKVPLFVYFLFLMLENHTQSHFFKMWSYSHIQSENFITKQDCGDFWGNPGEHHFQGQMDFCFFTNTCGNTCARYREIDVNKTKPLHSRRHRQVSRPWFIYRLIVSGKTYGRTWRHP